MKLHLGCGTNKLEGWINIDSVQTCQPDLCHDISQPLPYADQTADEILAEDLLEHFDKYKRFIVFGEWCRVLKMGGSLIVQVPDVKKILWRYFKLGFDNFVDVLFGETLWRSEYYLGHFGSHKWGYSAKTLSEFVERFGLSPLQVEKKGLNVRLKGKKVRHVSQEEIDAMEIYSHANRCGTGKPFVSVGYVREKIKNFEEKQ